MLWRRTRSSQRTIELLREYDDGSSCMLAKIEQSQSRASDTHILATALPRSQGAEEYSETVRCQQSGPRGLRQRAGGVQFVRKTRQAP